MELSIVIPVFNSEKTIQKIVRNLENNLNSFKYEIIFVNDKSYDRSLEVLERLATSDKNIKVVDLERNYGQQNAIFAGLHYCVGKYIITMDDDLQHSSEDIIILKKYLDDGYDLVYGIDSNNRSKGGMIRDIFFEKNYPRLKNIKVSSFRGFNSRLLKDIIKIDYEYIYLSAIILNLTNKVKSVEISKKTRQYGKTNYSFFMKVEILLKLFFYYSRFSKLEFIKPKGNQFSIKKKINIGEK